MAKETTATATTNPDSNAITNNNGLLYKPDKDKLVVTGLLTAYRFSTTKYKKDQEAYQVSVITKSLTPEVVGMIHEKYFSNTGDKYLPSWIKDYESDPSIKEVYINLKSQYEFSTFIEGKGNERFGYEDVIELGEGLPPLNSEVKLSIRLKAGACYPLGLMITKLNKQDVNEYFE